MINVRERNNALSATRDDRHYDDRLAHAAGGASCERYHVQIILSRNIRVQVTISAKWRVFP